MSAGKKSVHFREDPMAAGDAPEKKGKATAAGGGIVSWTAHLVNLVVFLYMTEVGYSYFHQCSDDSPGCVRRLSAFVLATGAANVVLTLLKFGLEKTGTFVQILCNIVLFLFGCVVVFGLASFDEGPWVGDPFRCPHPVFRTACYVMGFLCIHMVGHFVLSFVLYAEESKELQARELMMRAEASAARQQQQQQGEHTTKKAT